MSGMLDKLHRKHQIELEVTRHVTRQEMVDFAAIALNDAFGFGPERCKKFVDALNAAVNETADMMDADTKDMEYTIAKFEDRLKQVVGPYYVDRSERYGLGVRWVHLLQILRSLWRGDRKSVSLSSDLWKAESTRW